MKRTLATTCFFLSGVAALTYELAWIRKASLVFGSTTWALATVLAVFFLGLAIGAYVFGRLAPRFKHPIRVYAVLEVALAIVALLSPWLFAQVEGLYGHAYRTATQTFTDDAGLTWQTAGSTLLYVRILLVAGVLLIPTILMGGTLPLFCRQFVVSQDRIAASIGFLYGINTLGAALGAALTGFKLLPLLGTTGVIWLAAGLNVFAGALALLLRFEAHTPTDTSSPATDTPTSSTWALRLIPILFFTTGLTAVGAEVLWSRFLSLIMRNSVYTYTLTLTVVLLGIVLGSLLAGRLGDRRQILGLTPGGLFGVFQTTSALAILALMFLPAEFWITRGQGLWPFFLLMMPAAILSGASFPLANRLVLNTPQLAGTSVGRMTAINTVGGIVGSLLVGFWILPALGLALGTKVISLVGLVSGVAALVFLGRGIGRRPLIAPLSLAVISVGLWVVVPSLLSTGIPADYLNRYGRLLDVTEGHGALLATLEVEQVKRLQIDRLWQGSDEKNHQIMAAHIPALVHENPQDILVIGIGVGQTAGRFLLHDIATLDCVDIVPEIFPFIARNFDAHWMADPRVTLIAEDGRSFATHTRRKYDIVSVEVGQVFRPGVDTFYTREFYKIARQRLQPGGLIAQFVPIGFFQDTEFRGVLATFLDVFPQAVLWYNGQEMLLLGGLENTPRLALDKMRNLPKGVHADLAWSLWGGTKFDMHHTGAMAGSFLAGPQSLARLAAEGALYVDTHPQLAYAVSDVQDTDHLEAKIVRLIGDHLSPLADGLSGALTAAEADLAQQTRRLNLRDILASVHLLNLQVQQSRLSQKQALNLVDKALQINPESYKATLNKGRILLMARDLEQAIAPLSRAVAMRPDDGQAQRDLGYAQLNTGSTQVAMRHLRRAVQLRPDDYACYNYLGTAMAQLGHLESAIPLFERAVELNPGYRPAHQNLSRARADLRARR